MIKYADGYYHGQEVISTADSGPSGRPALPKPGAIGKIVNFDPYDRTFLIEWPAGSFEPIVPTSRGVLQTWTRSGDVKPYIPEVRKTEEGHRIDDYTGEVVTDDAMEMKFIPLRGWVTQANIVKYFEECSKCHDLHLKTDLITVEVRTSCYDSWPNRFCADCLEHGSEFYQCVDCGRWLSNTVHDYVYSHNGSKVCDDCWDNYRMCDECGEYWPIADFGRVANDDRDLCPNCQNKLKRKAIRNYGYKPHPKFKVGHVHDSFDTDESITELLMGVELEVDKGDDDAGCANEIVQNFPDVYCKHDGSLSCGIEIVSHPCTLEYHLTELGWDRISEICRKYRFKSHEAKTCGLHVHVGRRQLGSNDAERDKTAANLVLAMKRHWDNMVKFSRRLDSQLNWCEANNPDLDCVPDEQTLIDAALETVDDGRYQAVNLCNEATVELRLFRGTLEVNTIKATLEMVWNMCMYCKEHSPLEVMNSQWDDIAYYKSYPELYDYLVERRLGNGQMSMIDTLPPWEYMEKAKISYNPKWKYTYDEEHPRVESGIIGADTDNTVNDFRVGDYVLVTNHDTEYDCAAPVGRIGRVCSFSGDGVGVNFMSRFDGSHNLRGHSNNSSGYFVRPYHLMRYDVPVPFHIYAPCDEVQADDLSHLADPEVVIAREPEFVWF